MLFRSWRPQGANGAHQVSFGAHADRYKLVSTTSTTANWGAGDPLATTQLAVGRTSTNALWMQDAWRVTEGAKLTLGLRGEHWRAYDGLNFSAAPASNVYQPNLSATRFSPKASIAWQPAQNWRATASYGTAYRYPTVTELYQAVTVSGVVYTPNPNLAPERAYSGELALERMLERGRVRLSLFQESLHDALISQNSTIPGTNVIGSSVQNIDSVRSRGVELGATGNLGSRVQIFAGYTLTDAKITQSFNAANIGRRFANIPKHSGSILANYLLTKRFEIGGQVYAQSRVYGEATAVRTSIPGYVRFDAMARYQPVERVELRLNVLNLTDKRYYDAIYRSNAP